MGVAERYKEKQKQAGSAHKGVEYRHRAKNADSVGREIVSRINTWMENNNNFVSSYEERYKDGNDKYRSDSADWLSAARKQKESFKAEADSIKSVLNEYKDFFDAGWVSDVTTALDRASGRQGTILAAYNNDNQFWSQFDSEETYNAFKKKYDEEQALMNSADFKQYSQAGASIQNPSLEDVADRGLSIGGKLILGKEGAPVGNVVTMSRDNADHLAFTEANGGNASDYGLRSLYRHMTDDEVAIYNYYLGKGDTQKAAEYLASLEDTLNQRAGQGIADRINGNEALEALFGFGAGIENTMQGMRGLADFFTGSESVPTYSQTQYADQFAAQDNEGFNKGLHDVSTAVGGMMPSILVGSLTGGLGGALTMGASAVGNGYAEMRNLGYDEWQSRGYGLLVGASEATLQYALGGISKLGGKVTGNAIGKLVSKFDNAIARTAIKLGGNMASEGLEEAVQTVLEPAFKALMTGETFDAPEWEEVWYSALLGALSAGVLEGVPTIAGEVNVRNQGANLKASGIDNVTALADMGKTFADGTVSNRLGKKVNEKSGAYDVGRLLQEVGGSLSEQNIADIASDLEAKGMSPEEAMKTAKWMYKAAEGGTYSRKQQKAYLEDERISDVHRDLFTNEEHSVNKRNTEYDALYTLAQEMTAPKSKQKGEDAPAQAEASAQQAETTPVTENAPEAEKAVEGEIEASTEGKTTYNGNEVKVTGIAPSENGEVMLQLDNGEVANVRDVDFGGQEEGLIYEAIANMDPDTATDFIQGFNSMKNAPVATPQTVSDYTLGFNEAHRYGELGIPFEALARDGQYSKSLIGNQAQIAYNRGRINGVNKAASAQRVAPGKTATPRKYKGETHASEIKKSRAYKSLSKMQRAGVDGMTAIYKALGIDVYFFESPTDSKGNRRGKNGYFDPSDNSVHIDLYAGNDGRGLILFTGGHELTHYIRANLPTKFKAFADILFEQYEANGTSVAGLIANKRRYLEKKGRITPNMTEEQAYDLAYEEVVADACEAMLGNGEAFAQISEKVKTKDEGLWNAIKKFFTDLVSRIKKAYAQFSPDSIEGQKVAEMLETATDLQKMWVDALVEASEASDIVTVDAKTESVAPMLSERTWTASEYVVERDKTAKAISKALGVSIKKAYKYIDDINSIARLIADDRARLDYEPNLDEKATVLKPNSDYKYTVDMSTLCAKRLLFTGTFDAIQRALPNTVFDSEDIVALREMMQSRGYEVACGICYVESTRREIGRITQEFIDSYKKSQKTGKPMTRFNSSGKEVELIKTKDQKETTADPSTDKFFADKGYTPTLADLNTTDIDLVKRDHPLVYEAYLNFMNARGQAKPKLLETRAEYKGEILKSFKSKSAVKSRNDAGGLRLQSFSDFEVPHMIDMMQIVMDMSRVGLKSQAYTKVPAFAEIFGNTGVKINLSLIAKGDGIDANGNLIFDDIEGINHNEAFALRDKYSKNVGTILVGKNDAHIIAAMADPRIDYIIPFHKSSWKESLYDALGLTGYADYTETQHEKPIDKDRKIKDYDPSEYWDFTKSGDENAQIYLERCRKDGRIPKFPQFQSYPGYWKLLIDFKMYDNYGVGSPQEVVRPEFNTEASEKILHEYKGGHKSFPVAKDVVEDFVKDHRTREQDGTKYSDREIQPITESEIKDLAKHFGTTGNFRVAGYLLTDGKLLDFSGKHWGDTTSRTRQVDHRDVQEVIGNRDSMNGTNAMVDMIGSGNIRLMPEDGGINLAVYPNEKQRRVLSAYINYMLATEGQVIIDYDAVGGDTVYSREYGKTATSRQILTDIRNYFNGARQSELMQFHTMYSDREFPSNAEDIAKKHFGTTTNWSETGWLLTDGTQLDFSGRHWENDPDSEIDLGETYYRGKRNVEHYEIAEAFTELRDFSHMEYRGEHLDGFLSRGNIRIVRKGCIDLQVMPTDEQFKKLRGFFNESIDAHIVIGIGLDGLEFSKGTKASTIIEGIRDYFSKNRGQQSDLMRFHTMYSDRDTDSVSNRSLLANALESVAQNDIEKKYLEQYKETLHIVEASQKRLAEIRAKIDEAKFAPSLKDTKTGEAYSVKTFKEKAIGKAKEKGIDAKAVKFTLDASKMEYIAYVGDPQSGTILVADKTLQDKSAIAVMEQTAVRIANNINTYDKKLLRIEALKPMKDIIHRERQIAYQRAEQEGRLALAKYREKAAKTQRELLTRYQESRQKGIEGRKKTDMRHKIKNVVNELNQYLLNGTKEKHVPIELQKAVAEALDAVNMDTVNAEERIAKKREEMLKAKTPEAIEKLAKEISNIREMGGNMDAKLARLKTAYDSIINSDDPLIANSHDDVISSSIDKVVEVIGDTPLRDMSLYQLEAVYDLYRMVLKSIQNTNKAFKAEKGEAISIIANGVIAELVEGKQRPQYSTKAKEKLSEYDWNNQKPVYAFERIGSKNFTKVFNAVRAGEDVWAKDMSDAQAFREEQFKKYKYDSWDFEKKYGFTSTSGNRFELSLDQILSLYAFSKRAQAGDHLKYGGFVFDGLTEVKQKNKVGVTVKYQLKDATAYNLSEGTLAEIIEKLTPEQKEFADTMQDYLSTVMGEKGNEVSLALYDIKLFKEKHYFPLKSAPEYLAKAKEQAQGEVKIKNSGFTKETNPKAKNPIVLSSFMDVWAGHVNDMSMYHAFTLPLEDFYRVYNYHTPADEQREMMSVGSALGNAHGQAAVHYIDQLLKDLNGGARSDPRESTGKALMSNFKKAAVMASMSVVVQQPSAMVRAMALVNSRYFFGAKPTKQKHSEAWAEVKKYAPVAVIKEMGYFDTGMGKGSVEWLKGEKTFMDKVDDVTSKLPALADEITWVAIWNAVKRETVHTHQHLAPNSEAFLKAVGKRFTEVITKTQVYDSTLSRSANMRSKSTFMQMVTSFLAEPTTSINMLQDALHKGNKKYIARTLGAVYGSVILNAALVSIVYAMRDDDEDETFAEKYLSRFTTEAIDGANPLTYLPFVKDIWSIAQGFDIERADMSLISDLIGSFQNLTKVLAKDTSDMDEDELADHKKEVAGSVLGIMDSFSSLAGVPVKNIRRDINGVINTFKTLGSGNETTAGSLGDNILDDLKDSTPIWGWLPDETKGEKLYDAIIKGDEAYIDRFKSGYKSEDSYHSAVKKVVREHLEDGDISATEAERIIVSHGGVSEEDASVKVQYWEFTHQYPDYDLSEEAVAKYYSEVEPSGIGIEEYYDYYQQKAKCKGVDEDGDGKTDSGSKKAEILEVIDSMPITDEQKDALYFLNGWSESTLWQAPWH
jgi:hypothetical protein